MEKIIIQDDFAGSLEPGSLSVAEIDKESLQDDLSVARGYLELRTQKYKQLGYIGLSHVVDIDDDDRRSTHFTALESNGNSSANVVGSIRLISKEPGANSPLPIENMFGESLGVKVKPEAAELSRLIAEGEQSKIILMRLLQVSLWRGIENGGTQALAVVDGWFRDYLRESMQIPLNEVTPESKIDRYPVKQVGIDVDYCAVQRDMGLKALEVAHKEVGVRYYKF